MSGLFAKLTGKSHTDDTSASSSSQSSYSSGSMSSGSMSSSTSGSYSSVPRTTEQTTTTTTTSQYDNMNRAGYASGTTGYAAGSNVSTDDAITRSEERLHVGKEQVAAGSAALDKYVTSEHVERSVPVTKERVVIEREPITAENMPAALSGPEITEAHHEVHLTEERAIASKETVPIERIRLGKQVETQEQTVGAELRKEHVDLTTTGINDKFDNIGYGKTVGGASTTTTTTSSDPTLTTNRTAANY